MPSPEWVVNSLAELGVKIGDNFYWLYKGRSLVYREPVHDDGSPMLWRRVGKREFGECAHPLNYEDPSKFGTVNVHDGETWAPVPPSKDPDAV